MSLPFTVRPPFGDELLRVTQLLPQAASASPETLRIAAVGRVERIAAAAVLALNDVSRASKASVRFTSSSAVAHEWLAGLLEPLIREAVDAGVSELQVVNSVAENHPLHSLLLQRGFERHKLTEVYRLEAAALLRRVEPIYQRLVGRDIIPKDARVVAPSGGWLSKLKLFLDQEMPGLSQRVEMGEEGFNLDHSFLLLVGGCIAGVFFTRNRGRESYIGLILLAEKFRRGLPWANSFLTREMLRDGIASGVETLLFEVHPENPGGTPQIAKTAGAELICRRWEFRKTLAGIEVGENE